MSRESVALLLQECLSYSPVLLNAVFMQCFRHFARRPDAVIFTMRPIPPLTPLNKLLHVVDDEGRCTMQECDQPWCLHHPK